MKLKVWILEPDAAAAAKLVAAWRSVAGDRVDLQIFSGGESKFFTIEADLFEKFRSTDAKRAFFRSSETYFCFRCKWIIAADCQIA